MSHDSLTIDRVSPNAGHKRIHTQTPFRTNGFVEDLRAVLIPERKWHYLFHFVVMFVASSYWTVSLLRMPEATWAEMAMYRPLGDNELYPVVAALSRFNLGDPTDALQYGQGTSGARVVILLPYALAYAVFGPAGYMVADMLMSWSYFIAITLLLRRCGFGNFSSLLIGSALGSHALQALGTNLGEAFSAFLSFVGLGGTWEWAFPNLLELHIFVARLPRPMETEIYFVLLLYFLLGQWQERTLPTFRRGLAVGALFALIFQGDPFTFSAMGLVFAWVFGWTLAANGWRFPWRFAIGGVMGALAFGWYFLWQRAFEHADCTVRLGMADYPRDRILLLPGYGPLLRVGIVALLAALIALADRQFRKSNLSNANDVSPEKSVANFFVVLMVAGWLAQPLQLLLLGKGCEIYHYLIFVLPTLYAYGVVILLLKLLKMATTPELPDLVGKLGQKPHWAGAVMLSVILFLEAIAGMESGIRTAASVNNSRQETNVPWANTGNAYRPCFRALEAEFKNNPALKEVRSFASICYEVNFLLAGFYDKRAYLPDNGYSTLSDKELEDRLCETLKIMQLKPESFQEFVQVNFMLNYWLGCAKYWMTSDYQYSTQDDYTVEAWNELQKQPKESPWILCLPNSELKRLSEKYVQTLNRQPDLATYPDAVIVGLEKSIGLVPDQRWYREVYTNELFSVYTKIPPAGSASVFPAN